MKLSSKEISGLPFLIAFIFFAVFLFACSSPEKGHQTIAAIQDTLVPPPDSTTNSNRAKVFSELKDSILIAQLFNESVRYVKGRGWFFLPIANPDDSIKVVSICRDTVRTEIDTVFLFYLISDYFEQNCNTRNFLLGEILKKKQKTWTPTGSFGSIIEDNSAFSIKVTGPYIQLTYLSGGREYGTYCGGSSAYGIEYQIIYNGKLCSNDSIADLFTCTQHADNSGSEKAVNLNNDPEWFCGKYQTEGSCTLDYIPDKKMILFSSQERRMAYSGKKCMDSVVTKTIRKQICYKGFMNEIYSEEIINGKRKIRKNIKAEELIRKFEKEISKF